MSLEEGAVSVDRGLQFLSGAVADLLKSVKKHFGTEWFLQTQNERLGYLGQLRPRSENRPSSGENDEAEREFTFWDAVVKGIDNTLQDWWAIVGGSSTRRLRREMIADGRTIPDGHAVHHIVPQNDGRFPEADEARKILKDLGMSLDSSPNGVGLPNSRGANAGSYHPEIHTRAYYRLVVELLRGAETKEDAVQVLKEIGNQLSKGKFPK
jgi:hypothetical protein